MTRYLLDTSVVAKWFSAGDDPDTERALRLRDDYLHQLCEIVVPDLLFYELANLLRYRPRMTLDSLNAALESLRLMHIEISPYDYTVGVRAATIALERDISMDEAYFIALSAHRRCQMITADERLYRKIADLPWVILLSSMLL
jgi:predicted nucleic acid-binding protein